ncbi:MAG: protein-disulfide reductase DsbD domain-containing protein [Pseudomonadota bacterium]
MTSRWAGAGHESKLGRVRTDGPGRLAMPMVLALPLVFGAQVAEAQAQAFKAPVSNAKVSEAKAAPGQSAWKTGHAHASRLISGEVPTETGIATYAGVEIRLDKGWKTYWHNPGDAGGIPPHFDFSQSTNVALVEVRYPTPQRIVDETGTTFGYKESVTFPVRVVPSDPTRPVQLKLTLNFGVCEQICIPAFADHSVTIAPGISRVTPIALTRAIQDVPVGATAAADAAPTVLADAVTWSVDGRSLIVPVQAARGATSSGDARDIDLFPKTPPKIFLGVPKRLAGQGAGIAAVFEIPILTDAGAKTLAGTQIELTVVSPRGARVQRVEVPAARS